MQDLEHGAECGSVPADEQADVLVYIGDMAQSLAQMAQQVGHHTLSEHLYHAAQKARANL
ncbi:hypothetical protein [Asticcacaulis machinosus]|uniref:Uncharacterized protein n=1 Tax=Asticcacaulis machinosus TaxID=2984211 RepID=A0ABT5HHE1_9CAUL|nr:hypothetical protein [Asticcacaulis machinosus]MDC7675666.1 hypothetical protein [Asticcacaulis machinosus]